MQDNNKRRTLGEVLFGRKEESQECGCGCGCGTESNSCCSSSETDISSALDDVLIQDCGCGSTEQSCGCSPTPKTNIGCSCK